MVEAAPPLNLAQQLWRGVVPAQVRRGLRRIVPGGAAWRAALGRPSGV